MLTALECPWSILQFQWAYCIYIPFMTTYKKSSWITGTLCVSLDRQRLKMLGPFRMLQPALVLTPIFQSTASHQTIKRFAGALAIGRRITCAHWIWITCAHRSWVWWGERGWERSCLAWIRSPNPNVIDASMQTSDILGFYSSLLDFSLFLFLFSLLCIVKSP